MITSLLPANYKDSQYGLQVRFVTESDAEFIVKLRTNERNARYIHATDVNTEKQVEWIKAYKAREVKGEDYYFIFFMQENPVGLVRIYNIDYEAKTGTAGSWICEPDLPMHIPICIMIICREIMFDKLGLEMDHFDVRKGNKHVQRVHKMMGAEIVAEDEKDYYFELTKSEFENKKREILDLLNIE